MTTTIAHEVERRTRRGAPPNALLRLADVCEELLASLGPERAAVRSRYAEDPVGFARDVLGFTPCRTVDELREANRKAKAEGRKPRVLWSKQIEILESLARPRARVAVRSGHKVAKSFTAAIAALWFYACFDDARVVLTAVTARQVDAIIWREVKAQVRASKERIDGKIGELARTGIKSVDQREIVGFTARESEAVAGVSSPNLLYLIDEASGVDSKIFEAIEGNRAGGARVCLFSNPTRTDGEFFEAFHKKAAVYTALIHVSSEETPNAVTGEDLIPGLAVREWLEEKRKEWGETSPLYKVRAKGEFVLNEQGRIVSLQLLEEAEESWHTAPSAGRLHIGLDPAGPGDGGDDSAAVARRGLKVLGITEWNGASEQDLWVNVLGIIRVHAPNDAELPIVILDRDGSVGVKVMRYFQAQLDGLERKPFELVVVRSSDAAVREPQIYDRVRDELFAAGSAWIREGGGIPEHGRLAKELHAASWIQIVNGKLKATSKKVLREELGRSPDVADAFNLSVWDPVAFRAMPEDKGAREAAEAARRAVAERRYEEPAAQGLDPYAAEDVWR